MHKIRISGMPYFPGLAEGHLQRGGAGEIAHSILMLSQEDVADCDLRPAGFIVVEAAPFSHAMIGLLDLGLPTVLISAQQAAALEHGMALSIDGGTGLISDDVTAQPSTADLVHHPEAAKPVSMADGEAVNLLASVRQAAGAHRAKASGARGIGLVRSEFLSPADNALADTPFYTQAFGEICDRASPLTVTVRLLDVASSKFPAWLAQSLPSAQAAGMSGVRLYHLDAVRRVIDAQLAALSGLAGTFPLRVLLPFLTRLEEYEHWLAYVRQRLPEGVAVGAMAETPALVLDMGELLEHADFVAIGCNDLMQNLYAADRDRPELRHYLDPYAPLLYRLLRQVAEQAGEQIHQIHLCGVLAQIQGVLPVLLGLGYRTFSVNVPFIPYLAKRVVDSNGQHCAALAQAVCGAKTSREVLDILQLPGGRHPPYSI